MTTYSHSRLSTFRNCPLQFKFKYIDKVETEGFEGIEAFMGSRVHEALEKLYNDIKMCKKVTLEQVLDFFDKDWEKNWTDDIIIVKTEYTQENYKELGKNCIKKYWKRHYPFDTDKTLATEKMITVDLGAGNKLVGYIDRLVENGDGNYEIHDYKTSGSLPTQEQKDKDQQLALYQLALQEMWADVKSVKLVWHYLVFDKMIVSERTKEDLKKLKKEILGLIKEIETTTEFPPKKSALCDWCGYQNLCPLWKHIRETEDLEVNEFLNEPGVKLVNSYVKLTKKKKEFIGEIDKDLSKLEEALLEYSKKNKVEIVRGSDKKLKIKFYYKPKFPNKSDKRREELDDLIKNSGKWIEVSDLNTWTLGKITQNPDDFGWDKKLVDRIKKYQEIEERYRLSVSKFSEREKFNGD